MPEAIRAAISNFFAKFRVPRFVVVYNNPIELYTVYRDELVLVGASGSRQGLRGVDRLGSGILRKHKEKSYGEYSNLCLF